MQRKPRRPSGTQKKRTVHSWEPRYRGSRVVRLQPARRSRARYSNRFIAVAALYILLATGTTSAVVAMLHSRSDAATIGKAHVVKFGDRARYLVLIVLDGARPDYFGLVHLPNVDALRAEGVQYTNAMDGILESETPSGHTTLATGSSPAHNGILGFNWAQNDNDYSLFSPDIVRAGAMEQIMESAGVPTIAGLYKDRYPNARVVALSGHKYYAADPLGGPRADAIMYYQGSAQGTYTPVAIPGHMPPPGVLDAPGVIGRSTHLGYGGEDTLATRLAIAAFKKMHQRITLINYPEFDWPTGHVDGSSKDKVIRLMRAFDRDLGMIKAAYRRAGVLQKTMFVITADHGMSPVKRFVPQKIFADAVFRAGTTAPAVSYSTGTYIWLADPLKASTVASAIVNANDPGIQSVYYLSTAGSRPHYVRAGGVLASSSVDQANKYLLGTLMNVHAPVVVAFCKNNATSIAPTTQWKADHGGSGWQSQHIPLILAGPGIGSGQIQVEPAQLQDVAPTLLDAMGVKPVGMQGHPLTEALTRSTRAEQRARAGEVKRLFPLVQAMIAQDTYESTH
ncbi:MAG: hypothetical protein PVSMB7_15180 [Chloroflexota bacterium]